MSEWVSSSLFVLTQLLMLLGLFGLIIPVLPGTIIMWLAALGYGIFGGWSTLGWVLFAIITVLAGFGAVADNLLMGAGARRSGASWLSIGVAIIAGIAGTILLPPIGGIIAAPLAILLLEYNRLGDWEKAWQSFRGLATGFGISYVVRAGIGVLIMVLWWLWVWQG